MKSWTYFAADEQGTERLGAALATALPLPVTITLSGPLGAGKTRLVQAVAAAWRIPREEVISPTFVLCREHRGERLVYHLDAYRLADDDEFLELGVDEMFAAPAATFIEWAERVAACLPDERLEIRISPANSTARAFELIAHGARLESALAIVAAGLQ